MIDEVYDKVPEGSNSVLGRLDGFTEAELLALRADIDLLLPARSLKDLNLEEELVLQYRSVKALQAMVLTSEAVPANQQAQVANSCAATLDALVKMQERYVNSQRMIRIETILLDTLNEWPRNMVEKFLAEYETKLAKVI